MTWACLALAECHVLPGFWVFFALTHVIQVIAAQPIMLSSLGEIREFSDMDTTHLRVTFTHSTPLSLAVLDKLQVTGMIEWQ